MTVCIRSHAPLLQHRKKPRRPSGTGARTGRGAGTIPAYSVGRCAAVKGSLRRPGRFRAVREPSPLHTTRRPGISNSDPGVLAALDSRSAPQHRTVPSLTQTTGLSQPRPHQQPPPSFIAENSTISIIRARFHIGMDYAVWRPERHPRDGVPRLALRGTRSFGRNVGDARLCRGRTADTKVARAP